MTLRPDDYKLIADAVEEFLGFDITTRAQQDRISKWSADSVKASTPQQGERSNENGRGIEGGSASEASYHAAGDRSGADELPAEHRGSGGAVSPGSLAARTSDRVQPNARQSSVKASPHSPVADSTGEFCICGARLVDVTAHPSVKTSMTAESEQRFLWRPSGMMPYDGPRLKHEPEYVAASLASAETPASARPSEPGEEQAANPTQMVRVAEQVRAEPLYSCERCQMKLPKYLMTFDIGVRGGDAAWCAACRVQPGAVGAANRAEVVAHRRAHFAASPEEPKA